MNPFNPEEQIPFDPVSIDIYQIAQNSTEGSENQFSLISPMKSYSESLFSQPTTRYSGIPQQDTLYSNKRKAEYSFDEDEDCQLSQPRKEKLKENSIDYSYAHQLQQSPYSTAESNNLVNQTINSPCSTSSPCLNCSRNKDQNPKNQRKLGVSENGKIKQSPFEIDFDAFHQSISNKWLPEQCAHIVNKIKNAEKLIHEVFKTPQFLDYQASKKNAAGLSRDSLFNALKNIIDRRKHFKQVKKEEKSQGNQSTTGIQGHLSRYFKEIQNWEKIKTDYHAKLKKIDELALKPFQELLQQQSEQELREIYEHCLHVTVNEKVYKQYKSWKKLANWMYATQSKAVLRFYTAIFRGFLCNEPEWLHYKYQFLEQRALRIQEEEAQREEKKALKKSDEEESKAMKHHAFWYCLQFEKNKEDYDRNLKKEIEKICNDYKLEYNEVF